jgi:hypothetical protein
MEPGWHLTGVFRRDTLKKRKNAVPFSHQIAREEKLNEKKDTGDEHGFGIAGGKYLRL